MARTGRPGLAPQQMAELWQRWKAGQSMNGIGHALCRDRSAIHYVVRCRGGIAPSARRRSRLALTLGEREDISRGIAIGWSIRRIAEDLGRSASTVSREVTRHGGRSAYRATEADAGAWEATLPPKPCLLGVNRTLQRIVTSKLSLDLSPDASIVLASPSTHAGPAPPSPRVTMGWGSKTARARRARGTPARRTRCKI